ncbi:hypothetical protein ACROYT_G020366 [Oculina patagonica]
MKTFEAPLLLIALVVYVSANEKAFHEADFSDERHEETIAQAHKDQGLPEGTSVANDQQELCKSAFGACEIKTNCDAKCYQYNKYCYYELLPN